ncbi:hypothetical protein SAMN04490240_0116 [Rhodococcus pyridinivorans]|uniref:hypothetical protein n=1 Tax=Rhodococcus pyridinivorans TaxID=103816 RepID=UPI0007CD935D|nr:hypothetical protein [Rhodococcus pyridinivorans]SEB29562.1 hypothetical protein SAMN04490240_0116 [Rhodococcus pyridinivorans]
MADTDPEYRHAKCYANTRGGCSTSISGEHYISHALIRLYTFDDPDVRIKPTPNYRIPVEIQPKKFVANVLCTTHNNGLSDADRAALAFATFLRDIALRYLNGAGEWGDPEVVEISGDDFQRWVLKLLITHAAADVYTEKDGERVKTIVPDEAIDLLLDRAGWPHTWGLGVTGDLSNAHLSYDPFTRIETATSDWWSATPLIKHDPRLLFGGIVDLAGVSFTLCLFNQSEARLQTDEINPLRRVVQRPSSLSWELNGVPKTVRFRWSDPWEHVPITFTMQR